MGGIEEVTCNDERNNDEWIKTAKDQKGWKKMESKFAIAAAALRAQGTSAGRTVDCVWHLLLLWRRVPKTIASRSMDVTGKYLLERFQVGLVSANHILIKSVPHFQLYLLPRFRHPGILWQCQFPVSDSIGRLSFEFTEFVSPQAWEVVFVTRLMRFRTFSLTVSQLHTLPGEQRTTV